jgi:uncharacterized protein (DUF58 family)
VRRIRRRLENAKTAPTSKGVVLLVFAVSLFLIGTNTGSMWLYLLASGCLVVVVVSALWSVFPLRSLRAWRQGLVRGTQGELLEYPISVVAAGVRAPFVIFDAATGSYPAVVKGTGRSKELTGVLRAVPHKRGVHSSTPLVAVCQAPLGLWRTRRQIPCDGDVEIAPPLAEVGLPSGLTAYVLHGEGRREPPRRGTGYDFFALREYQSGDPVRHIYWPATARSEEVIVREFEEEGVTPLAVLPVTVDAFSVASLDRVLAVAGTLVKAAVKAHIPVRLAIPAGAEGGAPRVLDSPASSVLRSALAAAPAPVSEDAVLAAARAVRQLTMAGVVGIKAIEARWPPGLDAAIDFAILIGDPQHAIEDAQVHRGVRTWFVPLEGEICFVDFWQASAA